MKRILFAMSFLIAMFAAIPSAHAVNCALSNPSASTLNSTISSERSGTACTGTDSATHIIVSGTVTLSGTQIVIPCGSTTISLTGVVGVQPALPSTTIVGPVSGNWNMAVNACSVGGEIAWLGFNGGKPNTGTSQVACYQWVNNNNPGPDCATGPQYYTLGGGGGGSVFFGRGVNNWNIHNNYFYGFQGNTYGGEANDSALWFDGVDSNTSGHVADTNITITANRFGTISGGDCSNLMDLTYYAANGHYDGVGGACGGIDSHSYQTNLTIKNNTCFHIEQCVKFYEPGHTPQCDNGTAGCVYFHYDYINVVVDRNAMSQIHRVGLEMQIDPTAPNGVVNSNWSYFDPYHGGYGTWPLSLPSALTGNNQCFGNSIISTLNINTSTNQPGFFYPGSTEWWAAYASDCSHNWGQGYHGSIVTYGYTTTTGGAWTASYNLQNSYGNAAPVGSEGYGSTAPGGTGNVNAGTTITTRASATPSITTSGNSVTINSPGYTGTTVGPLGNTSAWYTTDGSNVVPGQGTAKLCGQGTPACTINGLANGTVVKTVAMWGDWNQPTAYPAGFGWVPSSQQQATVNGTGTPMAAAPTYSPTGQTFTTSITVAVASTTSGAVLHCTVDGTTPTSASATPAGNSFTFTATTSPQCIASASGYLDSNVSTTTYTFQPAGAVALSGCYMGTLPTEGTNQLVVGQTYQQNMFAYYPSGTTPMTVLPGPDANGTSATAFTSPNPAIVTIGAIGSAHPGLVTAIGAGSVTVSGSCQQAGSAAIGSSGWGWTVVAQTIQSIVIGTTAPLLLNLPLGQTNQLFITATNNDGSSSKPDPSTFTWTSSDSSKITVSSAGLITAVGLTSGTNVTITATQGSLTATHPFTTSGSFSPLQITIGGKSIYSGTVVTE